MNRTEGRVALLAALLSGIALALAFPSADQGWLAFIALTPLLRAIPNAPPAAAFRLGWLAGGAFHAFLLYWILGVMTQYGGIPLPLGLMVFLLLVAYLASYVGLFAALVSASTRRWGPAAILVAPVFWVGLELARARLLTGFPWGLVGYSQWRNVAIVQVSAWGGIYAVSFLVVLANASFALLLDRPLRRGATTLATAALLVVTAAHAGGRLALRSVSASDGPPIAVAAIQANVPQDRKWRPEEEAGIVAGLLSMTAQAADDGARLVVWPESSSPIGFRRPVPPPPGVGAVPLIVPRREYLERIGAVTRPQDVTLIAGSVDYGTTGGRLRAFNSAFVVGPGGTLDASYDKVHLVPFGEYVPLQRLLFFVDTMVQGAIAGFAPGDRLEPLPTPLGPVATFVCYEAIFPELVRALARPAVFMVNITNDAWFGKSAAPTQHLAMAVFRAAENRRWLLRAANTGISAIVDPAGRVRASTDLMTRTVLLGTLAPRRDRSLYAVTGDLLAWACVTLTALSGAAHFAAFKRPRIERPGAEASHPDGAFPRHR
jgi:apolipoprotein N-acyltransferase